MNARLTLFTVLIFLSVAAIIFLINESSVVTPVRANVFPREVSINDFIFYSDSTEKVNNVIWEFGNGHKSLKRKGNFKYTKEGNYMIRLTLDNGSRDTFSIKVLKPKVVYKKESYITIHGNKTGIVGEAIHFKILGSNVEWCEWYFGESGKIDARGKEAFYTFSYPGNYTVKVISNINSQPISHTITILPKYKITEGVPKSGPKQGEAPKATDQLKMAIQVIAEGKDFNENYKKVVNVYLCSNPRVPVVVNGKSSFDFYSYCQSLQLNSGVTIDAVVPVIDPNTNCTSKLIITQH